MSRRKRMPDSIAPRNVGGLRCTGARPRPTLVLAVLTIVALSAAPSFAQTSAPAPGPSVEFLPRTSFHMMGEHLSGDDEAFVWDAHFGGELDVIDWGLGRATFLADYHVVLGEEFKAFDPNQGNYTLDGSASVRVGGYEIVGVFHHLSRHLSDRLKRVPVDWNMLGGRIAKRTAIGAVHVDASVDIRKVIQKTYVDYTWELAGRVRNDIVLRPSVGALFGVQWQVLGVDGSRNRGTQAGARGEGGVRIDGEKGAVELFLAVERRIDPEPLAFGSATWFTAGFRLLSQ